MSIKKKDIVNINLNTGNIYRSFLNHSIGAADSEADCFGIRVFRDNEPVDLSGCSCYGYFRNNNGENIAITAAGTVDGNVAYITLPQACYNYEGQFCLAIKLIGGGVTGTMRIIDGMVDNTHTGSAIAPTETVPTYTEILSVYDEMVAAVAVANSALAPEFVQETANEEGAIVINGDAVYVLPDGHEAGDTWSETTKEQTTLGDEISKNKTALEDEISDTKTSLENEIQENTEALEIEAGKQNATHETVNAIATGAVVEINENINGGSVDEEYYQGLTGEKTTFSGFDLQTFNVEENTTYFIGTAHGYSNAYGVNYFNGSDFIGADIPPNGDALRFYSGKITTPPGCTKIRLCRQHSGTGTYPTCFVQEIGFTSKNLEYKDISDLLTWINNTVRNLESDTQSASGFRSATVEVKPGEKYYVIGARFYNFYSYILLNNRGGIISYGESTNQVQYGFYDITIPENAEKMIVNGLMPVGSEHTTTGNVFDKGVIPAKVLKLQEITAYRKTGNAKITFMGDSLTDATTLSGAWGTEPNYTNFVAEALDLDGVNKGVGGSGWRARHDSNLSFMDIAETIDTDSDIVTIFGSWNDGTGNIGEIGSTDITTLYGAVEQTIKNLIERVPNAKIGIITPTPWEIHNAYNAPYKVEDYCKALKDVAYKYSLPVLDLFSASNLRPWDSDFKSKWYMDADGTHPSSEAHRKFIAPKVIEFVKTMVEIN